MVIACVAGAGLRELEGRAKEEEKTRALLRDSAPATQAIMAIGGRRARIRAWPAFAGSAVFLDTICEKHLLVLREMSLYKHYKALRSNKQITNST